MDSQESMRAATFYISGLLHEVDAFEGDLVTATASTIRIRAPRWTAITCTGVSTSGANLNVTIKKSQLWGVRNPSPTLDSLIVFILFDQAERLTRGEHQNGQRDAGALPESHNPK